MSNENKKTPQQRDTYPGHTSRMRSAGEWARSNTGIIVPLAFTALSFSVPAIQAYNNHSSDSESANKPDKNVSAKTTAAPRYIEPGDTLHIASTETNPSDPQETLAREMLTYFESDERNSTINNFIEEVGRELVSRVEAGEKGWEIYYFDDTEGSYASRDGFQEGWGWLQSSGDSETQWSVTVYTNKDGSFDLSKGVLNVYARQIGKDNATILSAELSKKDASSIEEGVKPSPTDTFAYVSLGDDTSITQIDSRFVPGLEEQIESLRVIDPGSLPEAIKLDADAMEAIAHILAIN